MSGAAERSTAQARQALEQAADELNRPGPSAPFAATPLTSLPATPGEGVDQARFALGFSLNLGVEPLAATPLTSLPATPGEGVDQARCASLAYVTGASG